MDMGASLFTDIFWATLAFLFLAGIIGTVLSRRQKDRCLKMLDDFHVTLVRNNGELFWGDLRVFSQGIELEFDKPDTTRLGQTKSGVLIYDKELVDFGGFFRGFGGLTQAEKISRQDQIKARFRPSMRRRFLRSVRNWVGTIQDAFNQALGVFLGQLQKSNAVLKSQKSDLQNFGTQIIGMTGNAWEPMLERLLGKPVVVELSTPAMTPGPVSLSGTLAEYSSDYIALLTGETEDGEICSLIIEEGFEHPDFDLVVAKDKWALQCKSASPWVFESLETGDEKQQKGCILINGSVLPLGLQGRAFTVHLRRLKEVDAVLSRQVAVVRYAGGSGAG